MGIIKIKDWLLQQTLKQFYISHYKNGEAMQATRIKDNINFYKGLPFIFNQTGVFPDGNDLFSITRFHDDLIYVDFCIQLLSKENSKFSSHHNMYFGSCEINEINIFTSPIINNGYLIDRVGNHNPHKK